MQAVTQRPATHVAAPHRLKQPPQLFGSLPRSASQPFAKTASQSPRPALQAATTQRPEEHTAEPFRAVQTAPHRPQLLRSDDGSIHTPAQSTVGATHVDRHTPDAQTSPELQRREHPPQCITEVLSPCSQPLVDTPSQSPHPEVQVPGTDSHAPKRHRPVMRGKAEAQSVAPVSFTHGPTARQVIAILPEQNATVLAGMDEQRSVEQRAHARSEAQEGSAQSVKPSQSSSTPPVHRSGLDGAGLAEHIGDAESPTQTKRPDV